MSDITNEWRELRSKLGDLICHIDGMNESIESKMKKLQEKEEYQAKIDEAYNKGLKDMHEALRLITTDETDDGMSMFELKDASVCGIILGNEPREIIDKVLEWATKRKESQELHVGDEVITEGDVIGIITSFGEDLIWITYRVTSKARGLDYCWVKKDKCKKTGRHFDSIPFDYNLEKDG